MAPFPLGRLDSLVAGQFSSVLSLSLFTVPLMIVGSYF